MKENNTKNVAMPNIENREHRKNSASTGSARNSGKAKIGGSNKCSGGIRSRERTRSNGSSGRNRNSGKIAGQSFSNVSETAVDALVELTHSPELKEIKTQKYTRPEGGIDVCLGIQGMIQDGRMRGIKEGKREGKEEAKKETACSLSTMGMSVEEIGEATKSSVDRVREWLS